MGYKCDVCEAAEGEVFCMADGAVMCKPCDVTVHTANKLVRKHERVGLTPGSQKPNCDICQEGKAVIFCIEDRAVMCRGCDLMIHSSNELTSKHQRFVIPSWQVELAALPAPCDNEPQQVDSQPTPTPQTEFAATVRKPQVNEVKAKEASVASRSDGSKGSSEVAAVATVCKPAANASAVRHARQTADYSEYGALRALLGVPEVTAGIPAPRQDANNSSSAHSSVSTPGHPPTATQLTTSQQTTTAQQQLLMPSSGAQLLHPNAAAMPFPSAMPSSSQAAVATSSFAAVEPSAPSTSYPSLVTLTAAELLGMPAVTGELSAKDIDAVYLPDAYTAFDDFDMDFSSLFEVPDLGPCTSDDFPVLGGPSGQLGGSDKGAKSFAHNLDTGSDGVVPDLFAVEPSSKRARNW